MNSNTNKIIYIYLTTMPIILAVRYFKNFGVYYSSKQKQFAQMYARFAAL